MSSSTDSMTATSPGVTGGSSLSVETNGINVISESERKGRPNDLFWPWCASNIAVLGMSYGTFLLYFGISFWQAVVAGAIGIVVSFLLVGLVALAGKRGSAPTMVLSRAAFGVRGNALPSLVSYVLLVGWETVLVSLSTLATATVFGRLGWSAGNATKIVAFLVVAAVIVGAGILGFDAIMRLQRWLTIGLTIITIGYIALTAKHIHWDAISSLKGGSFSAVFGAGVLAASALGIGWVNSAADYSRYLPRRSSSGGVVWWTAFGGSIAPLILVGDGLLLAGSNPKLMTDIGNDPIGALTTILPTWYLVPFVLVAVGGLISGAVLDIYSSGLTLLTLGLRIPRWSAAALDGVLMILGTIWVLWYAGGHIILPFEGFLITLAVPLAAWCGCFLADLASRRSDYDQESLYDSGGRYGSVNPVGVLAMLLATAVGWGLVTVTVVVPPPGWLGWQGYLLSPLGFGGKTGSWAGSGIGVLIAFAIGFVIVALAGRARIRTQEQGLPTRTQENLLESPPLPRRSL
ncbi:MAG: purine-cytosine permease family protein [Nocardioidaceae bacterium]